MGNKLTILAFLVAYFASNNMLDARQPLYSSYTDRVFDGVALSEIAELVNANLERQSADLSQFLNIASVRMGPFWRKAITSDVFTNDGWAVQIKHDRVLGRLYIDCVPATDSLEDSLRPIQYVSFIFERREGKLEVVEFERRLVMNY